MKKLTILLIFFLGACGFQPLYGSDGDENIRDSLNKIMVATSNNRLHQMVSNNLIEQFGANESSENALYSLDFIATEKVLQFGFKPDQSITRESYKLTIEYSLINLATSENILSGTINSQTSYDVVQSDFSNFRGKEDAQERMAQEVAKKLNVALSVYFKSQGNVQ